MEPTDRQLVAGVADQVARPKVAAADSFVLHAPLELLARAGLLRHVRPEERPGARARMVRLGEQYAAAGPGLDAPVSADFGSPAAAAAGLTEAIAAGDLDAVDTAAEALGRTGSPEQLRQLLARFVAPSLAAAGHASILLYLLTRVAPGGEITGRLLRGAARELARHPDRQLRWFDEPVGARSDRSLEESLLDVPVLGLPGSDSIDPIMTQAEASGVAPDLLGNVVAASPALDVARVALARVAVWSMLQEPPDHAPYGWSHCLTMPQAVTGIATRRDDEAARTAVAVAATYVVGFRAALGKVTISPRVAPEPTSTRHLRDAIETTRDDAAGWVWHAPADTLAEVRTELATRAALHRDAHLAKYTLACFDAAGVDRDHERLYLAAAASLSSYWATRADQFATGTRG